MKTAFAAGMQSVWLSLLLLGLTGCVAPGSAPVSDRASTRGSAVSVGAKAEPARSVTPQIVPSTNGLHTVQRGDTLYAIAFANSLDYREVASWNKLESVDRILIGQVLRLSAPPGAVETLALNAAPEPKAQPLTEPSVLRTPQAVLLPYSAANWAQATSAPKDSGSLPAQARANPDVTAVATRAATPPPLPATAPPAAAPTFAGDATVESWLWPADGALAGRFGAAGGKGIDIVGSRNAPVKAVASGKVVYSGSGLRGYGQLLIVKHAGEFLSAYAHNETILVKEGDMVTAGQNIARMGDSDADRVKLHFEIRRYGKPLDPLNYLPERS